MTYVELNSPDLEATAAFTREVFGWEPQLRDRLESSGGTVVVEPFTIPGVGRGCYVTDPTGLLIGLHEYDSSA